MLASLSTYRNADRCCLYKADVIQCTAAVLSSVGIRSKPSAAGFGSAGSCQPRPSPGHMSAARSPSPDSPGMTLRRRYLLPAWRQSLAGRCPRSIRSQHMSFPDAVLAQFQESQLQEAKKSGTMRCDASLHPALLSYGPRNKLSAILRASLYILQGRKTKLRLPSL